MAKRGRKPKIRPIVTQSRQERLLELFDFGHRDGGHGTVRVWRKGWSGDVFQVMSQAEFEVLKKTLEPFSFFFLDFDKECID